MRDKNVSSTHSGLPADYNVENALREAATAIDVAHTLLRQGGTVDLDGLETHVEQACSAIPDLPASDRQFLKPTLVALIDGLNSLSEQLSAQHRDVTGSLQNIGRRHTAVSAYKPRRPR